MLPKYGIEIEETKVEYSEEQKKHKPRELLYKIHRSCNTFFKKFFGKTKEKAIGLSYFKERELHDDIIKNFNSVILQQKDAFTKYALEKATKKEILEKSGPFYFPRKYTNWC